MPKNSPNLTIRLSQEERFDLEIRAKTANMTLGAFARSLLVKEIARSETEHAEVVSRLVANGELISEFREMFQASSRRLEILAMSAIASAAMLRDDGRGSDDEGNKKILSHLAEAVKASPGLLQHHKGDLNS